MLRGHLGQRFRKPPKPNMIPGRSYTVDEISEIQTVASRFFETTGIPDGKAWIEIAYGADEPYFVLNIGRDWRGPIPELAERFEGYPLYSEPGRVVFA